MAPTLPDLPTELLVAIARSYKEPWERIMTATLRCTCKQLNEKLVFFFGSIYFANLDVKMDDACITALQLLARGPLGIHVLSLKIYTNTLIQQTETSMQSESSSQSDPSWYSHNETNFSYISLFRFDEDVLRFVVDGSCCVKRLVRPLGNLSALNSVTIHPPAVLDTETTHGIKAKKLREIKLRWSMAMRALLATILNHGPELQALRIKATQPSVAVPISALNLFAMSPHRLTRLCRFEIDLDIDVRSGRSLPSVSILR